MVEYKNGFNVFGGISVDSSRVSSDVQTGRAVYVNEDEYSDEPDYKNRVDQTVNEGYHREAPFEAPEIVIPEPIIPSGTKNITENGVYDVAQFAKANVNVAGGGSSDLKNKTLTMTVINNSSEDAGNIFVFLDNNGMIENNSVILPAANETGEYASLIVPSLDMGEYSASLSFDVQPSTTATASNENNCTFNNGMFGSNINITDYTQDASITITLSDS